LARKGKILKVRRGYNANSSSLAAEVTMLLFGSGAVVALLSMVAAALFGRRKPGSKGTRDAR
jgi:hypothetical protein